MKGAGFGVAIMPPDVDSRRVGGPSASSQAARRLGLRSFILGQLSWPGIIAFAPASRVGFSELFGDFHISQDPPHVPPTLASAVVDACAAAADRTPAQACVANPVATAGSTPTWRHAPCFTHTGGGGGGMVAQCRQTTAQARPARPIGNAGKTFMMMLGRRGDARGSCHRQMMPGKCGELAGNA